MIQRQERQSPSSWEANTSGAMHLRSASTFVERFSIPTGMGRFYGVLLLPQE